MNQYGALFKWWSDLTLRKETSKKNKMWQVLRNPFYLMSESPSCDSNKEARVTNAWISFSAQPLLNTFSIMSCLGQRSVEWLAEFSEWKLMKNEMKKYQARHLHFYKRNSLQIMFSIWEMLLKCIAWTSNAVFRFLLKWYLEGVGLTLTELS